MSRTRQPLRRHAAASRALAHSAAADLQDLVTFCGQDLRRPYQGAHVTAARRALEEFLAPSRSTMLFPRSYVLGAAAVTAVLKAREYPAAALARLQADTIAFVDALLAGTTIPSCRVTGPLDIGVGHANSTRFVFLPDGSVRDVFWYQLLGILGGQSLEPIRRCKAADCRRLFYRVRRMEYCSSRCRNRTYMRTYRA